MTSARQGPVRQHGFTLIELLMVVALVAVLAKLAAPAMSQFIRASKLNSAANQFQADLMVARREAIRRNNRVLMCPKATATATTCLATITGSTDWASNGWLICYDNDADGACDTTVPTGDAANPIRSHGAVSDVTINTVTTTTQCPTATSGLTSSLRFNADGTRGDQTDPANPPFVNFLVQGSGTTKLYCATVSNTGNVAMTKPNLPTM